MVDAETKIRELVALDSENELVEFKEANNDFSFEDIGKYFSALSNEANLKKAASAWLVFGVKDTDHSFTNTNYRRKESELQNLKAEVARHTSGNISFLEIYSFDVEPGKRVIMFQIPSAPLGMPVSFKGHYYAREHESLVPLNLEKVDRIRAQGSMSDWSMETASNASIRDLSPEAIAKAREFYKIKHPDLTSLVDSWNDKKFLNKAKITIGGEGNKYSHTSAWTPRVCAFYLSRCLKDFLDIKKCRWDRIRLRTLHKSASIKRRPTLQKDKESKVSLSS